MLSGNLCTFVSLGLAQLQEIIEILIGSLQASALAMPKVEGSKNIFGAEELQLKLQTN
jgi:hypothetical protein